MPEPENDNRVRVIVNVRGLTDERLNALKNGIRGLLNGLAGAVMNVQEVEQFVEPAPEPPPPE